MNILEKLWFRANTGANIENLGLVEETVIKFKGYYITVLENEEGIASLGWSDDPGMTHVPIREFWTAKSPKK